MEFYNHQHFKYTGIKGFITVYNDDLKYRYMINRKSKEKDIDYFIFKILKEFLILFKINFLLYNL